MNEKRTNSESIYRACTLGAIATCVPLLAALRVANVIEGTVRKEGKRIRITIRLVDARTDKALWSESYDRDLRYLFYPKRNRSSGYPEIERSLVA
jgi:hypothetical protein